MHSDEKQPDQPLGGQTMLRVVANADLPSRRPSQNYLQSQSVHPRLQNVRFAFHYSQVRANPMEITRPGGGEKARKLLPDERSTVVSELADAIQKLVARSEHWHGPGGDLLKRIGKGPWTENAGTMVGYLQDAAATLKERGIVMAISPKNVNGYRLIHLGESWMFDADPSDSDLADDDERTSKLYDALNN